MGMAESSTTSARIASWVISATVAAESGENGASCGIGNAKKVGGLGVRVARVQAARRQDAALLREGEQQ